MSDPKRPAPTSYNPDQWENDWSSLTYLDNQSPQERPVVSSWFWRGAAFAFACSCLLAIVLLLISLLGHYIAGKILHGG